MRISTKIVTSIIVLFLAVSGMRAEFKSKFDVSLSGYVKFDLFHDNSEVGKGDYFFYANPGDSKEAKQEVFSATAKRSRIGLTIDGPQTGADGKTKAYIEADFAGGYPSSSTAATQPLFRIRQAWAEYSNSWFEARIGQDYALIGLFSANSVSSSNMACFGNLWIQEPQVRLTFKKDDFKLQASINRPVSGNGAPVAFLSSDPVEDGERSGKPWYMGRLAWETKELQLSASAHYGLTKIASLNGKTHNNASNSLNVDILAKKYGFTFMAKGFAGENLKSFNGGIQQGTVADSFNVENVKSHGAWASLQYQFNDRLASTVAYGFDDPDDGKLKTSMRSKNTIAWGNLEFNIQKALIFMLEGQYVETDYINRRQGHNFRLHFCTFFKF